MSRGGRGGGRGGRGGGRGGRPNVPWDTGEEPDGRPTELFPLYNVPEARPLKPNELSAVRNFILLRHQHHASPLYTSQRTLSNDPTAPKKIYGREQANALYGVRNRASQDPFTAMPTYGQHFARPDSALPNWSNRPICRELFPKELLETIDPPDGGKGGPRKKRRLELSRVNALPNAEEAFGMPALNGDADDEIGGESSGQKLLERLNSIRDDDEEGGAGAGELEEEEEPQEEDRDEEYDDEDAGDYDAENYFDGGEDFGEDYDEGDGEGTF